MRMITVERPEEEEVHLLVKKYGEPVLRELRFDMRKRDETQDYPKCKGGTRIAVNWENGVVLVRHKGGKEFGLPGGRILAEEPVEDGAIREAEEETGLRVELRGMPELHRCKYLFKNWNLERWIFVFLAKGVGGTTDPRDTDEIQETAIFEELPSRYHSDHWLRSIWDKCMNLG